MKVNQKNAVHYLTWIKYCVKICQRRLALIVYPSQLSNIEPEFFALFRDIVQVSDSIFTIWNNGQDWLDRMLYLNILYDQYSADAVRLEDCKWKFKYLVGIMKSGREQKYPWCDWLSIFSVFRRYVISIFSSFTV